MGLFAVLTYIGAAIAALLLAATIFATMSAPQQAAMAAIALCFVVIPYCVFSTIARSRSVGGSE